MKVLASLVVLLCFAKGYADVPCQKRPIKGESVVCVCNATYCDTIEREIPEEGSYVAITTSKAGLRFKKSYGELKKLTPPLPEEHESRVLEYFKDLLIPQPHEAILDITLGEKHQTIKGFGGAVTDSAGLNWKSLEEPVRQKLIDSYFSPSGIGFSFIRVPIGGSDFSTHPYGYNDFPENDKDLTNYTLTFEDYEYKMPMIRAAMAASPIPVHIVGTTWSPPTWMKSNDDWVGFSRIKKEYFQTYADYHYKFIEAYTEAGIKIWAITTTNEPFNGVVPVARFNSVGWSPSTLGEWIADNLGPTIKNSKYNDTLILAVDDQRYTIVLWFEWVISEKPEVLQWIDGVALHWYGDFFTPASFLEKVTKKHPEKFLLGTEASSGYMPTAKKVYLGAWSRAVDYIRSIIENVNSGYVGWIDWNLCLDTEGGPNWAKNPVDAAIIVDSKRQEFIKQPMFYALGHFGKFVPRGSVRIGSTLSGESVEAVTFLTPDDTVVTVAYNSGKALKLRVRVDDQEAVVAIAEHSIVTVELRLNKTLE